MSLGKSINDFSVFLGIHVNNAPKCNFRRFQCSLVRVGSRELGRVTERWRREAKSWKKGSR